MPIISPLSLRQCLDDFVLHKCCCLYPRIFLIDSSLVLLLNLVHTIHCLALSHQVGKLLPRKLLSRTDLPKPRWAFTIQKLPFQISPHWFLSHSETVSLAKMMPACNLMVRLFYLKILKQTQLLCCNTFPAHYRSCFSLSSLNITFWQTHSHHLCNLSPFTLTVSLNLHSFRLSHSLFISSCGYLVPH